MTTRAVAYIRVSTAGQADEGVSLAAQREKLRAYASLYDLEIVDFIEDAGSSAKTLDRPGLQSALGMLDAGEADALLVAKLDRLTRSVRDLDTLLSRYFAEGKHGLLSVAENIDTRSAAGRLVLNILASVSQWEREAIGERTREALAHKKAQGQRVGGIPFGFRVAADGAALEECPEEQEALALIRALRADGLSIRAIANELAHRGVPARGQRWSKSSVGRICKALEAA